MRIPRIYALYVDQRTKRSISGWSLNSKNTWCSSVMVWVVLESVRRGVLSLQIRVGLVAHSPIVIVIGVWSDHAMVPIDESIIS